MARFAQVSGVMRDLVCAALDANALGRFDRRKERGRVQPLRVEPGLFLVVKPCHLLPAVVMRVLADNTEARFGRRWSYHAHPSHAPGKFLFEDGAHLFEVFGE